MNLQLVIGLGLAAAALYAFLSSSSSPFMVQGTTRFWKKDAIPELKAKLATLRVSPHPSIERIWILSPQGPETALARVLAIQNKKNGNVVASAMNLDSPPMGAVLSELTPAEFGVIDTGPEGSAIALAVVPLLVEGA